MVHGLPAVLKQLEHTAAALAETGIGQFAGGGVEEHHAARGIDGLGHGGCGLAGHALITLAVIVGANIEVGMVLAVLPAHYLIVGDGARAIGLSGSLDTLILAYLRKKPAAGYHGVRTQQLGRGCGAHL